MELPILLTMGEKGGYYIGLSLNMHERGIA